MFSKVVANCKIYCVPNSCKVPSSNLEVTRCFQAQVGAVGVVTSRVKSIYNLAKSIFRTSKRRYLSFKGIYYRSRTWKASEKTTRVAVLLLLCGCWVFTISPRRTAADLAISAVRSASDGPQAGNFRRLPYRHTTSDLSESNWTWKGVHISSRLCILIALFVREVPEKSCGSSA